MSTALRLDEGMPLPQPPMVLAWHEPGNPLPLRVLRATTRPRSSAEAPACLDSGPAHLPFDFCGHARRLCADVVARCAEFEHIDVDRILVAVTQARSHRAHGLQARVTPLRFRGGDLTRRRRGTAYQVQRYFVGRREVLYVVTFCLPRFLDLDFDEKLVTLFHELYHISPAFDGDLRRHGGRYCVHSHSQRAYDRQMAAMAREYLSGGADPSLHAFLRLNFAQLEQRHGGIVGVVVPRPKLIPVSAARR